MNFCYPPFLLCQEILITQEEALPETVHVNCLTLELVAETLKDLRGLFFKLYRS